MKRIILSALGLCLIASTAMAQTDAPPPPPPKNAGAEAAPPPAGGPEAKGPHGDRDGDADRDHGPRRKGPHGGPDGDGPRQPPSRAAEFHFRRGPMDIRIRCSEDEAIKPCVDGAIALMHELGGMRRGHGGPGGDDMAPPSQPSQGGSQYDDQTDPPAQDDMQ